MTLRLTFEIVPFGDETRKYTIHTLNISNAGQGPYADGSHAYHVTLDGNKASETIHHIRDQGALKLVHLTLGQILSQLGRDKAATVPEEA